MKFTLIATIIAVLALAHGSLAQDATDLESLSQMFENMKNTMTERMTELLRNEELQGHAQTVQEHLKTVATNLESQFKPVTDNMQANLQPVLDNFQRQMESIFQMVKDRAGAAIGN